MIESRESITANLCSFARAYHSTYANHKIFDDFLAFDFLGIKQFEKMGQLIEHNFREEAFDPNEMFYSEGIVNALVQYMIPIPVSRIAYAERSLLEFAARHGKCQYVICGAGMDTFSFRNEDSDIEVFELDHPDMQNYKLGRIKELEWTIPQNVHFLPIDFSKTNIAEVLANSSFDPTVPTFFSVLGVTYYLPLATFESTIEKITESCSAVVSVVFDFPDDKMGSTTNRGAKLRSITKQLGEPMAPGYPIRDLVQMLHSHDLMIADHQIPESIQTKYFNKRTDGLQAFENIHFVLAFRSKI